MTDDPRSLGRDMVRTITDLVRNVMSDDVPAFEIVVVTSVVQGRARVRRLADTAEEPRDYTALGSLINPAVGDTVLCARYKKTLVLLGRISKPEDAFRGLSIVTMPVFSLSTAYVVTTGTSYAEPNGSPDYRSVIPFGDVRATKMRMGLTINPTNATGTKGVQITDLSDVELYKYEWTSPDDIQDVTTWGDVDQSANLKVKLKFKHTTPENLSVFNVYYQLLVGL